MIPSAGDPAPAPLGLGPRPTLAGEAVEAELEATTQVDAVPARAPLRGGRGLRPEVRSYSSG